MYRQLVFTGTLVVGLTTVGVTDVDAKQGSGPIVEHCRAADGTYQIGCRLVPGRPDGWFVPTDVAISTPIVPGNVR